MKAIILAAGIASRLRPLTDNTPKCLLKIGETCLLARAIEGLISNGINELVIVTGYLQEQIKSFVSSHYPDLKVEYIFNEKYASTNNIYSLWLTSEKIYDQDIVLLDSDIIFDPLLLKTILTHPAPTCLALNRHSLSDEEIKVIPDANGRVAEISKTCAISKAIGESIGIEKMDAAYTRALTRELEQMITKENLVDTFYESAFERLIAQGCTFDIVDTTDFFSMELDTIEDFQQAVTNLPPHLL